jgi:Cu+-exporting ATPase
MHPEVQQEHPGDCPKCGMTLEPKTVTAGTDDEENAALRDMTKRFWIGAALTLPVFSRDDRQTAFLAERKDYRSGAA